MTFFDNMLELNNSFLLIALIIIAVICIYLLYSNLTKSGETASLKSGLTSLILQNKKRDEIINFLLERIENLEHTVVPQQNTVVTASINKSDNISVDPILNSNMSVNDKEYDVLESNNSLYPVTPGDDVKNSNDFDTILSAADLNLGSTRVANSKEVNDILDSMNNPDTVSSTELQARSNPTTSNLNSSIQDVDTEAESFVTNPVQTNNEAVNTEFQDLESEFDGLLNDPTVYNVGDTECPELQAQGDVTQIIRPSEDGLKYSVQLEQNTSNIQGHELNVNGQDLVATLLDADEEPVVGDNEIDLSSIPKNKDKLNVQYTVKQLKSISRQLKLKSKGNKTELINRIYEKLN